ncbi:MAG: high-potential iron-sulfur protein [Bdellovibrionales bacterium]|nr:high-potential iron-sulfur protein [Bdellovibrionales bacterium]
MNSLLRFLNSFRSSAEAQPGRRGFMKAALVAMVVVPAAALLEACKKDEGGAGGSASEAPPAGMTAVNAETDATAKALGYHEAASTVDTAKWPKRAGEEGAKQSCLNCSFYAAANGSWGKCTLIPSGVVAAAGWCNSWSPKAPA